MGDHECVICLEESCSQDLSVHSPNRIIRLCMSSCECSGFIHVQCLKDWIARDESTNKTKCPICRTHGENFTLLECLSPVPAYQPPAACSTTISSPPPSAPPVGTDTVHPTQPPDLYQYPQSSTPVQIVQYPLPTIPEESNSVIIPINEEYPGRFDMARAQAQEQEQDSQRRRILAGFMLLIVLLILVWAILVRNE